MDNKKWRQAIHLEAPDGWINDPNGLCFFHNLYHVYYQYSPKTPDGSAIRTWGLYTSPDWIHWKSHGVVIPSELIEERHGVFSGSALVEDDTLHLFYTGNVMLEGDYDYIRAGREANEIHVTTNDGIHMNPKSVMMRNRDYPKDCSNHVRDPKVWKEDTEYRMVLGARTLSDEGQILLYGSKDKEHWNLIGRFRPDQPFGYMWECPDLFELQGQTFLSTSPQGLSPKPHQWMNRYQSGYFRLKSSEAQVVETDTFEEWDLGFDFYAPQTFEHDGRRILIGWMGMGDADYTNATIPLGYQHCLTLPRELTVNDSGAINQYPLKELDVLFHEPTKLPDGTSMSFSTPFDLQAKPETAFEVTLNSDLTCSYENGLFTLKFLNDSGCGRTVRYAEIEHLNEIRIIVDVSSLEIYLNHGEKVLSTRWYSQNKVTEVTIKGTDGTIRTADSFLIEP